MTSTTQLAPPLDRLAELERLAFERGLSAADIRDYRRLTAERDERVAAWVAGLPRPVRRRKRRWQRRGL